MYVGLSSMFPPKSFSLFFSTYPRNSPHCAKKFPLKNVPIYRVRHILRRFLLFGNIRLSMRPPFHPYVGLIKISIRDNLGFILKSLLSLKY